MKKPKMIKIRITQMNNNSYKKEFYAFMYSPVQAICWHDEDEYPHLVHVDNFEVVPMSLLEQIPEESDKKIEIPAQPKKYDLEDVCPSEMKLLRRIKDTMGIKKITVEF